MAEQVTSAKRFPARRLAIVLIALVFANRVTHAHQVDEYIQSTLVSISPSDIHLSVNLTRGTAIASQVLADLDLNKDGVIATNEASAYALQFQRDLTVTLNEDTLPLNATVINVPDYSELTNGFGMIQLEFSGPISLHSGPHQLKIQNRHFPKISAYLVNATQPKSPEIQIVSQTRNQTQTIATIAFSYTPAITRSKKFSTIAVLGVLYCAMLAGVLRWQTRRKRR